MNRLNLVERRLSRFLREPPSIRLAAETIVTATVLVVIGGGVLMTTIDHREYPNVWIGMWWSLQTVTTVGYGDVVPRDVAGRVLAAFVMLEGAAFLAIVTAAITSTFVARATQAHNEALAQDDQADDDRTAARFDELDRRLDRIEALLRAPRDT
jgi:voltage-gated potassium channel